MIEAAFSLQHTSVVILQSYSYLLLFVSGITVESCRSDQFHARTRAHARTPGFQSLLVKSGLQSVRSKATVDV